MIDVMKYRIKELRKAKGWTLEHLASVVGTSKGYISDLERGKRTGGVQMLRDIAQALGVSERDIFEPESRDDQRILKFMNDFLTLSPEDQQAVERHAMSLLSSTHKSD